MSFQHKQPVPGANLPRADQHEIDKLAGMGMPYRPLDPTFIGELLERHGVVLPYNTVELGDTTQQTVDPTVKQPH